MVASFDVEAADETTMILPPIAGMARKETDRMIPPLLIIMMVTTGGPTPVREIDANLSSAMTKVMTDPAGCDVAAAAMRARSRVSVKVFACCEKAPQ